MSDLANLNLRGIKRPLRDGFRGACVRRGLTMKQVITQFMKTYVRNDGKINKRKEI